MAASGDVLSAISKVTSNLSPENISAALMIINIFQRKEEALSWKEKAGLNFSDFDIDGQISLFNICFELEKWGKALEYAKQLDSFEYRDNPALLNVLALTYLINSVPSQLRNQVRNQIPFRISPFEFSSDSSSLEYRKKAIDIFKQCSISADNYKNLAVANIAMDYSLWIELGDQEQSNRAKQVLENDMEAGGDLALRRFPLAMQFQLDVDLIKIETELNKKTALTGGRSTELALARFAMAFMQSKPHKYIEKHRNQLFGHILKPIVHSLEIQSLIKAGEIFKAKKLLLVLEEEGMEQEMLSKLQNQITVHESQDQVALLISQYDNSLSIGDLVLLVEMLKSKNNFELLEKYAEKLYKETKAIIDAERVANTKAELRKTDELYLFLKDNKTLINHSIVLQKHYAWSLYTEGKCIPSAPCGPFRLIC